MKFGLAVSGRGNLKVLEKMALKADEVGYDSFLVTDHFLLSGSNDHIDVWSFLPYIAGKTSRIRLGTCVTPIPFRPPAILAKMIASCDVLSGGRIILGAGFGWYQPEFEAFSKWLETGERVAFSREALELMLRLWHEKQPFDFHGRFIEAKGVVVEPRPVQSPHPPILWGGHQPASLRTATRYADGWMPIRAEVVRRRVPQSRGVCRHEEDDLGGDDEAGKAFIQVRVHQPDRTWPSPRP